MSGFDCLGAQPFHEFVGVSPPVNAKAQAAGNRAIAAAKKIAKKAPKLAASVAKAGQKALALGTKATKATAKPWVLPGKGMAAKPQTAPSRSGPSAKAQEFRTSASAQAHKSSAPGRTPAAARAHVGDDPPPDQQADVYANLADAAARVADFVAMLQDYMAKLPAGHALIPKFQNAIDSYQFFFGGPIDDALSGTKTVTDATQGIVDTLNMLLDQQNDQIPTGVWELTAAADAYLSSQGAQGGTTPTTAQPGTTPSPGTTAGTPVPGTTVAKIVITPISTTAAAGMPTRFSAQTLDAAGKTAVPKSPVAWAIADSAGQATIDQAGNFYSQSGGSFTVTATADGLTTSATVQVQSGGGAGGYGAPSGGGGGGGGGGNASSGGGDEGGDEDEGGSAEASEATPPGGSALDYLSQEYGGADAEGDDSEGAGDDSEGGEDEVSVVGKGGGHGGGGHGGHRGGGRGFRRGSGGPWWYGGGPWWDGAFELDGWGLDEEPSAEDIAKAVVKEIKKGKTTHVGGFDLGQARKQMDALKQVPLGAAMILLRRGQAAITQAFANARQPWYKSDLPGESARNDCAGHLKWHQDALQKVSGDPKTTMYASGDDLKKWVLQAFIEQNATEEGQATLDQAVSKAWDDYADMWVEIAKFVASLPAKVVQAVGGLIKTGIESLLGVPIWALVLGGFVLLGGLGYGVYRLMQGPAGHMVVRRLTR